MSKPFYKEINKQLLTNPVEESIKRLISLSDLFF